MDLLEVRRKVIIIKLSDTNTGQIQLGSWSDSPFISISPVFDAYKGHNGQLSAGEKPFDHDKKIFWKLDENDLVKLNNYIIPSIENEEIKAAQIEHKSFNGKFPKRTLEIGMSKEFPVGYIELCMYNEQDQFDYSVIFDFAADKENSSFITNPDENGQGEENIITLFWDKFSKFIEGGLTKKMTEVPTESNSFNSSPSKAPSYPSRGTNQVSTGGKKLYKKERK